MPPSAAKGVGRMCQASLNISWPPFLDKHLFSHCVVIGSDYGTWGGTILPTAGKLTMPGTAELPATTRVQRSQRRGPASPDD